MPIYTVEHNGKVFDIEGPAGATPEQLRAAVGSQPAPTPAPTAALPKATEKSVTRQAAEATLADMPWYQRTLVGAGKAVADVGRNLGLMDKGDKEIDATLTDDTAGMLGNVGGEIAMTALPGAAAYRGATAIPRVARMGQYGRALVGGAAAGAAGEGTMGRNPLEGAAYGAAFGPVGTAVGNAASGTVRGARRLFSSADDAATRYLRELSTDPNADAAVLRSLRGLVPGEMPTSGMAATVDPRMQYLAAIENQGAARGTGGAPLARAQANEAARMAPLENIAAPGRETFNPMTRQMEPSYAQGERSRVTGPMYANAMEDRVAVQPTLAQVLRGAEVMPHPAVQALESAVCSYRQ